MISLQAQELFARLIAKNESSCEKIIQFSLETASRRGLLGYTEELSMPLLYSALVQGIFPWYNEDKGEPVLWWSPDPRFVLFPEELHVPKSLAKFMKHSHFSYTMDTAFEQVINECSSIKRKDQRGTWIGSGIKKAYTQAFYDGNAHSFEVWNGAKLAGGFYDEASGQKYSEWVESFAPNYDISNEDTFTAGFKSIVEDPEITCFESATPYKERGVSYERRGR